MKKSKYEKAFCIATLLLPLMVLQCSAADELGKASEPTKWGEESNGFRLAVFFEKTNFIAGEKIVAYAMLKNTSSKTHGVLDSNNQVDFRYTLENANGKEVPLTDYGKKLDKFGSITITWSCPNSIKLGEVEKSDFPISRIYDLKVPGKYVFVAVRRVPNLTNTNTASNMQWYEAGVTSNPAIFYITDQKEKTKP